MKCCPESRGTIAEVATDRGSGRIAVRRISIREDSAAKTPHLDQVRTLVHHCITMRTTVDLPDDIHTAALTVARQEGISLGAALARAWRQAARPARKAKVRNGVLVLEGGDGITPESVRDALAED